MAIFTNLHGLYPDSCRYAKIADQIHLEKNNDLTKQPRCIAKTDFAAPSPCKGERQSVSFVLAVLVDACTATTTCIGFE